MAGKRVAKSLVDWAAFAERVPPGEKDIFRLFKAKSTGFITKIHQYPESLPAVDFGAYKKLLKNPKLVESFEAGYAALTIPYPVDKDNIKGAVLAEEKEAQADMKKQVEGLQTMISEAELMLKKLDTLPQPHEMTHEMFADYFPESAVDPEKPTMYPHSKPYQPENIPNFLK